MKKHFLFASSFMALLLLIGAGCATTEDTTRNDKTGSPVEMEKTGEAAGATTEKGAPNGIQVTKAESSAPGTLEIEFEIPEALTEKAEAYRLLLSNEENPTWPTEGYWYELGRAHQSKTWTGLPSGERHFRVCVVTEGLCDEYSNDMLVNIK